MILECLFALLAAITCISLYKKQLDTINKLENDIFELKNNNTITINTDPLDGIFEVHITINPEENYVKLIQFIDMYKEQKMKIVYAVSTAKINQYMLSYFTKKNNHDEVIEFANSVAADLEKNDMKVLRVKIEGHSVKGTPSTKKDYIMFKENMIKKHNHNVHAMKYVCNPYFEFHVKVEHDLKQEFHTRLENDIKDMQGVAISYNMCSNDRKPLLTMRIYDEGFMGAVAFKDAVMNKLRAKRYIFEEKIQQEFSIYDTNSALDGGWLDWK